MKILNLTDRTIRIVNDKSEDVLVLPPERTTVKVKINQTFIEVVEGIEVVTYGYSDVKGLPDPKEGIVYLVNFAVLQALNNTRKDVIAPDTAPASIVREVGTNKVIGVKKFRKL